MARKIHLLYREATEEITAIDYRQLLLDGIGSAGPAGLQIEGIRERVGLLDKLTQLKQGDTLLLEEAEWMLVVGVIQSLTWATVSQDVVDFCDSVIKAQKEALAIAEVKA